jgi:hypothetical protein
VCVGRVRRQRQSVRRPRADKGGKVCVCECKQSAGSPRRQQRAQAAGNHFVSQSRPSTTGRRAVSVQMVG